jgi:exopolysaccharide production protein ExoQ
MATVAIPYSRPVTGEIPAVGERAYVVCVLILASGAFLNLRSNPEVDEKAGMPFMQALWALIYLVLAILLLRRCRRTLGDLIRQPFLWLPVLWVVGSVFWSGDPGITIRKGAALVLTTVFGSYLSLRFTQREFLRLLAVTCGIIAVSSLVFGVLGLGTPVDHVPGWYGIFTQKNQLGRMMVLAQLVFLIACRANISSPVLLQGGLILCTFLLLLSRSMTALVATILLAIFLQLIPGLRRSLWKLTFFLLTLGAAGVTAVFWVAAHWDIFTDLLGRDATMTGRLQLWAVSFLMALRHPWVGYGYYAFWLGLEGPSRIVWMLVGWHAPHPHNGLLSVWLDIGLIGIGLLAAGYIVYFRRAVQFYGRTITAESIWPISYLVFYALAQIAESSLLVPNTIFWMLFVAVAMQVSKSAPKGSLLCAGLVPSAQPERLS